MEEKIKQLTNADGSELWFPRTVASAVYDLDTLFAEKQNVLTGTSGQLVGFDTNGNAVAQDVTAENIVYDNTASGLTATNVQDAIDEVTPVVVNITSSTVDGETVYTSDYDADTINNIVQEGKTVVAKADGVYYDLVAFTSNSIMATAEFALVDGARVKKYTVTTVFASNVTGVSYSATVFLSRAGGVMTGALTLVGDPTSEKHAATKQYVDNTTQPKITGVEGQFVGFDADGNAVAVNATVNTSITIPAGRLVGDINGDGVIDSTDFNLLVGGTGSAGIKYFNTNFENDFISKGLEVPIDYLAADTSTSGDINMLDMNALLDINAFYPTSYDLLNNWSKVEGATSNTEYPFYVDIQSEYADNHHDFIIIADNACPYISSQAQIVSGAIRIFAKWLPVNNVNANVTISNGDGNASIVIAPNAVTETINTSISNIDTGSVFTQLVKPANVPESCVIDIEDMFFQANGYTYLLYLIDAASENTYKKYVSKTTLASNKLTINFSDIPDSNIKMHFTRINVGSGTSRIAPIYNAVVQNVETGGKRTCRFVIGTSTSGWTASDCDYLCDGTEDNVEIQAAIDALPDTGGEIVILDGTYNISAGVSNGTNISSGIYVTKPNVSLVGSGSAIFSRAFQGASTIDMSVIIDASETNMHISGLKFVGNRDTYSNSLNLGIKVGSDSVVEDCIFSDIRSNMINGESFVCRNNIFEDWTDTCISVSEGDYVEFTGNKFILQGSTTSTTAISVDSTRFLCANNTFEYVAYAINATSVYDCNITGNVITNSRRNSIDISGVDVVEEDWYIEVAGNVLIANNIITNSEYARTIGIKLSDLYNAKCSNNIIRGTATGIHAYNIVNSVVSENAVYHSSTASIKLTSECKNNLVVSNTVLNYNLSDTSATIDDGEISIEGTGNTVSGNKINSGNPQILPITTEDNGKFMRVVNGAWAAVAVPSAEEASF